MRLFTKDEFEEQLSSHLKLTRTENITEHGRFWKTQNGKHIHVPELDDGGHYPDYLLDEVFLQLELLENDD